MGRFVSLLWLGNAFMQAVEKLPLASLPQKVQTLTYEKIRVGLELFLRLARDLFEQPAEFYF
jgi:hypothetical protein